MQGPAQPIHWLWGRTGVALALISAALWVPSPGRRAHPHEASLRFSFFPLPYPSIGTESRWAVDNKPLSSGGDTVRLSQINYRRYFYSKCRVARLQAPVPFQGLGFYLHGWRCWAAQTFSRVCHLTPSPWNRQRRAHKIFWEDPYGGRFRAEERGNVCRLQKN